MSITRHPARSPRAIASPKFSSRRDELRRQIRVWPPPQSTTASATNAVRLPSCRSKASAPKQVAVGDQQRRDVVLLDDGDAELGDLGGEGVQDRPTRVVAGVARAPPAVGAEEPLVDAAVLGAGELASPRGELLDRGRRLAHDDLDDARIAEQVALAERVGEVLLPRVLRIAVPSAALIPPDASTVCASSRGRLPTTTTSAPA